MADRKDDDILFDAILKVAAAEAFKKEITDLPSGEELSVIQPSAELNHRIARLIERDRRKSNTRRFIKTAGKIAACICVIITVASAVLLSIDATRTAIFNAVMEWQDKYTKIDFGDNEPADDIYRPTYLPEGFKETSVVTSGNMVVIFYSSGADEKIVFNQWPAQDISTLVDCEDRDYIETKVAGSTAYLFEGQTANDKNLLIWQAGGTVFELSASSVCSGELILMGESLNY